MPWPNLTQEEKDWIKEHGCIHGMFPDEDPLFCPTCKPDMTDLKSLLSKRCETLNIDDPFDGD
jgi:hypothetical protein